MPVVTGHFVSLNGKTLDQLQGQHFPRRMLENAELSWSDTRSAGDKVCREGGGPIRMRTRLPSEKASRNGFGSVSVLRSNWKLASTRVR